MEPDFADDQLRAAAEAGIDADIFNLAPVSLWLQDYSGLVDLFERWRAAGVRSLSAYFAESIDRVQECVSTVRVIKVNQQTVKMYGAGSAAEFVGPLDYVFTLESMESVAVEFVELWNGRTRFQRQTVNRSLSGQHMDVVVTGFVLPGHEASLDRVLVAVQDITDKESAFRKLAVSERYARGLFDYSPISLWVEDFSVIKRLLEDVRARGITDFRVFIDVHEEFVERCLRELRIVDVNDHTLRVFRAPDRAALFARLPEIFRDKVSVTFREQLAELWEGNLHQQREITTYNLDGEELYMHMQLSVFPGYENDWTLVQVALTDITARKKAEAYLEFLGKHDDLTKLYNRAFYVEEIRRLERKRHYPVAVIVIDMNGLKQINDEHGHMAGDDVLRRLGEVLAKAVDAPAHACRIGGDEFAILMPRTDEDAAAALLLQIEALIILNNQFHSNAVTTLRIAAGIAVARDGERVEDAIRTADLRMYEAKNRFYQDVSGNPTGP